VDFQRIAKQIIALKDADLNYRDKLIAQKKLSEGYDSQMEYIHIHNAEQLDAIIDKIGFPTVAKVGREAHEAAWLIVQHAISKPSFMRKCLQLLNDCAQEHPEDAIARAYLSDRIAVLEAKPQRYGTQFDWDDNGVLSPNAYDDLAQVNKRRLQLGLNTLEEQTALLRAQAKEENQTPPNNILQRRTEVKLWKKRVGW
jgi:hypothetical protein